jgi:hypothetical protein
MRTRTTRWNVGAGRTLSAAFFCLALIARPAGAQLVPDTPAGPEGFHAALLLGTNSSGAGPANLPAATQKALKEASEVLAFKHFELLDQVVLRGEGSGRRTSLRGQRGRVYRLDVSYTPPTTAPRSIANGTFVEVPLELKVAVVLTEASAASDGAQQPVLRTTMAARMGQTAVIGTSASVTGASDQALLLLLTPIEPGGAGRFLAPLVEYARTTIQAAGSGDCRAGDRTESAVAHTSPGSAGTPNVRLESGLLVVTSVVVKRLAGDRGAAVADTSMLSVRLRDVVLDEGETPGLVFACRAAACAAANSVPLPAFQLAACPDRAPDVRKAIQILALQAGSRWSGDAGRAAPTVEGRPSPLHEPRVTDSTRVVEAVRVPALTVEQATAHLKAVLASECGTGTVFQDWPPSQKSAVLMKTQGVSIQDGVLHLERVPAWNMVAEHPEYQATPGKTRVYRVRLSELEPKAVDALDPMAGRQDNWLAFRCVKQGCVDVDGNRESTLMVPVCAERRADLLMTFQRLITDVASAADPSPRPGPRNTLVSALHVVLLRASNSSGAAVAGLAPQVAQALQDAAKVGPYKRFELLDQAVVRGTGTGFASLRGPDARRFGLVTKAAPGGSVYDASLSLTLFETGDRELASNSSAVMAADYTAKAGELMMVWPADTPAAAERPTLVLLVTPLTPANAETFLGPAAAQAMAFLTSTLFSACGTEATFYSGIQMLTPPTVEFPASGLTLWRTAKVTLRDWVLALERFTARSAGSPGGARRTYRAKLALLNPEADVPVGAPANQPGGVIFRCTSRNCVLVEGAGEPLLQIPICPEKRDELIAAMQILIVAAGGGWESPASTVK